VCICFGTLLVLVATKKIPEPLVIIASGIAGLVIRGGL
jgi:hypothetical protein